MRIIPQSHVNEGDNMPRAKKRTHAKKASSSLNDFMSKNGAAASKTKKSAHKGHSRKRAASKKKSSMM